MKEARATMLSITAAIVIVGEDLLLLELMDFCLSTHGYPTIRCPNYDLRPLSGRTTQPALFILDFHRAHTDTVWQTLYQLRSDPSAAEIPMIVCSMDLTFLKDKVAELKLMGVELLAKPFGVSELLMIVERQIGPAARASW